MLAVKQQSNDTSADRGRRASSPTDIILDLDARSRSVLSHQLDDVF
jgi:hypothetical protein